MRHRGRKKAEGFTLLELLIVVAIIGVLAAVAIPNLVNASVKSKYSRALADTKQIVSQAQLYQNDNNAYPAQWSDLQGGKYMASTSDPFAAAAGTQYGGTITAAPLSAFTTGVNKDGAWPVAATSGAGYASDIGCAVGTSASIPTGVRC
jgi:prepilin-type N-terminal cleavage/methylation domain-containing protein